MAPSISRRIEEDAPTVTFTFEGQTIEAKKGDSVAAALTAAGVLDLRSSVVSGESRGIFCMMGACFECLMNIDGQPNRQACMTEVSEGLVVLRQQGSREVDL
ncbi:(2Fe-2S)-binding protein [Breoghania sp.]|uniref:(2Fe-2S)-binding protein n=1 Tax=Breoghania sp. TaxID=2065378 RepID=UPI002AA7CA92|nr:(2Fe-2S)-binding protein [Breoghania sp.]